MSSGNYQLIRSAPDPLTLPEWLSTPPMKSKTGTILLVPLHSTCEILESVEWLSNNMIHLTSEWLNDGCYAFQVQGIHRTPIGCFLVRADRPDDRALVSNGHTRYAVERVAERVLSDLYDHLYLLDDLQ